jgi:hypothetical protein
VPRQRRRRKFHAEARWETLFPEDAPADLAPNQEVREHEVFVDD